MKYEYKSYGCQPKNFVQPFISVVFLFTFFLLQLWSSAEAVRGNTLPLNSPMKSSKGGDCCMKTATILPFHITSSQNNHTHSGQTCPPWRNLSPTRRSASRSASGGLLEWRMLQSWRRDSIVTCTSLWWKTETLQHPGIITLPWPTLWEITWWGDG